MSYHKKQVLKDNLAAIRLAFDLVANQQIAAGTDREMLLKFNGWGGIKELLLPLDDIKAWSLESLKLKATIEELHQFLSTQDKYQDYLESIKNSILTSFYTPTAVIESLGKTLVAHGVSAEKYLDPSAGTGLFQKAFESQGLKISESLLMEKDALTAMILQGLNPSGINHGFEMLGKKKLETYDLVSSNIPFGNFKVFDEAYNLNPNRAKRLATNNIHNYFMVKSLDALKIGGLMAHIMPQGVLDSPANLPIRQFLLANANLISAVRLPNNTFLSAGTEAGSDLLILQKTNQKTNLSPIEQSLVRSSFLENSADSFANARPTQYGINEFFKNHPTAIISDELKFGTDLYGKPSLEYFKTGGIAQIASSLEAILQKDFSANYRPTPKVAQTQTLNFNPSPKTKSKDVFQLNLFGSVEPEKMLVKPAKIAYPYPLLEGEVDGQLMIHDDKLRRLTLDISGNYLSETNYPKNVENLYRLAIQIRQEYEKLYRLEATENIEYAGLRTSLNTLYNDFHTRYGAINSNKKVLDEDPRNKEIIGLERVQEGKFVKSDIFHHPIAFNQAKEYSIQDAFYVTLNQTGFADIAMIQKLANQSIPLIEETLLAEKLIAFNPKTERYEGYTSVISGNVIEKINWLENQLARFEKQAESGLDIDFSKKERFHQTLSFLKEVVPTPIPYQDLDFNLGERWISPKIYEDFARKLFNSNSVTVDYLENTDNYIVSNSKYDRNEIINTLYAVAADNTRVNGIDLLEHALYNTSPKMEKLIGYDEIRKKNIYVTDKDKTILVNSKIDEIRQKFINYLEEQNEEFKAQLAQTYNHKFNCYVKPQYDGKHLSFKELNLTNLGIPDLYQSQKDAIWTTVQQDGGIIDHQVGLGKSLTMIVASHEMKRLGVAQKPLILCLKANVAQIAETYKKAYPNARILYSGDVDFSKKNREVIFNQIKNNNWDCVILTHDQFGKIPHSSEAFQKVLGDELTNLQKDLASMNELNQSSETKQQHKGLIKRKINLEAKLKTKMEAIKGHRDDVLNFDSMGFDHIFVDESHIYKNLTYSTRHNNVAGLGSMEGSDRALNMLVAIRTLQEKKNKDLCVTFLSGTPISNSLNELYLLFKYLRPKEMKKQQIFNFDSWIATYGVKSKEYEISITNNIIQKERFREYIKVPELAIFYSQITDYKTSDMAGIFPPKAKTELVVLPQTLEQMDFSRRLQEFANTGDGTLIYRGKLTDSEEKAKMLIATNESKKMALDMRLINPYFKDDVNNKINQCCLKLWELYQKGEHYKATQMIFCDLSTPSSKSTGFNVYEAIRDKLMDLGIPKHEIAFIQQFKNDRQRQQLFDKMNSGDVRALIGSTATLGTGVNAQKRMIAMHHLDIPWKPSEFEQRIGRGARQGNEYARQFNNNEIHNFVYAVEQTLDSYKFNLLLNKSIFINQIKANQLGVRKIDEGGMDETNGMNYAEYCAILSGNTMLLDKAKLERELSKMESEKAMFLKGQKEANEKIGALEQSLELNKNRLETLSNDKNNLVHQGFSFESEKTHLSNLVLNEKTFEDFLENQTATIFEGTDLFPKTEKEIGQYLVHLKNSIQTAGFHEVGEYFGMRLYFESIILRDVELRSTIDHSLFIEGNDGVKYTFNGGFLANTPEIALNYPHRALLKIPFLLENVLENIDSLSKNVNELRKFTQETFQGEQQIETKKKALEVMKSQIDATIEQKDSTHDISHLVAEEGSLKVKTNGVKVGM
ncbi:helicase-related protein [Arcicella sp. LKC2W]|uniref:helicase-related protein n=1 Tax=Arcicella sp. LKC2W TaxID=2984198 RepID=UPI002B20D1FC|nr:helicase-related protein [Arcicella sp. LKC2W]MEA5461623.1 helicase-related protein [Arcicella sp. LKC2W]